MWPLDAIRCLNRSYGTRGTKEVHPAMSSRTLLVILAAVMAIGVVTSVQAQTATPSAESPLASLGLPEIILTVSEDGLELSQTEVPAGRYLVTLDSPRANPSLVVDIVRLVHDDSALCEERLPPLCYAWYYQTYLPGGVSGWTPQAIMNLPAGEYGFWGPGELGEEPAAILTVTGDRDATIDGPEPQAASVIVTKAEDDRGFVLKIAGELKPGPQIIKIGNAADQPILIAAAQEPGPSTSDQVIAMQASEAPGGDFPLLNPFDETQFGRFAFTVAQSPGTTQWVVMDLTPGPVYVAGYLPDPTTLEEGSFGWYAATAVVAPVVQP